MDFASFLSQMNDSFGLSAKKLFDKINSKVPNQRRGDIKAYRDLIAKKGPKVDVPECPKNVQKAAQVRQKGNQLYREQNYPFAVDRYILSICLAPIGSKDLAMGYANCSAQLILQKEFEHALVLIDLAKKYHYPEPLMPKLLQREADCKRMLATGHSRVKPRSRRFELNVKPNAKIPFLAEGITMKVLPEYGRGLVAEKEFQRGDVILDEEMVTSTATSGTKHVICGQCTSPLMSTPWPCGHCVSLVYCSEECCEAGWKAFHRFECGITEKLDYVSYGSTRIGLRMLFHGLNLFDDNVDDMMEFCSAHARNGIDPLSLDYTERDRKMQQFLVFQQTHVPDIDLKTDTTLAQAALYYSVLVGHSLIRALFTTKTQRDFLLQCIHDYVRTSLLLACYQVNMESTHLYTVAALCNHSCIPNTYAVASEGSLKLVVLRPIRPGEQILTSYHLMYAAYGMGHTMMNVFEPEYTLPFKCICAVCKPTGARLVNSRSPLPVRLDHLKDIRVKLRGGNDQLEDKLNALQKFMQRYGHLHPDYPAFDEFVRCYRESLTTAYLDHIENERRIQSAAIAVQLQH